MADSPPTKQRKLDCSSTRSSAAIAKKEFANKKDLDRYPDGQILKELLQYAEDARATEFRLILDKRHFGKEKLYDERLSVCQGPAILTYYNATLTKEDWKNIQKTEHSYKEMDSKKIGRFGIGFNSIYNLTDFPWIMSDNMIGVFDPCQRGIFRDPVIGYPVGGYRWDMTDEDDKNEIKQFADQFTPLKYDTFDPKFGSHFNGTLFRFPLRQQFVEEEELFKAFETDGDRLLLFLTSIQKVSLWVCSDDNKMVESYSVRKEVQSTIPKPLESIGNLCYYEADIILSHDCIELPPERWAVVQYISKDPTITGFISELKLNLLPWVGVACPLDVDSIGTDGYISCFLPLPPDNENRTGLPIEVHGYFCLSESRRSVLWPSAEQNDRQREWNEILAKQLIPCAYIHLLEKIKRRYSKSADAQAIISLLWPDQSQVKPDWENPVLEFYKKAVNKQLFWCVTNKWVTVSEAVFLDSTLRQSYHNAIQQICIHAKVSVVSVPKHVPDHFPDFAKTVSPKYVCTLFKSNPGILCFQPAVKKQLLNYVLSDPDCSAYLEDVPLLPLADGSFVSFNHKANPVYISSAEHPRSLLPGLDDSRFLSDKYFSVISHVLESGLTQLRRLKLKNVRSLALSIKEGCWKPEELENLWQYINGLHNVNMDLTVWHSLSIIPILAENQKIRTTIIDSSALVLSSDGIDSDVCQWLKNEIGLKLALPEPYLKCWLGSQYILNSKMPGSSLKIIYQEWKSHPHKVVSAVQKACSGSSRSFDWLQKQILMSCAEPFDQNMIKFLTKLPLFLPVNGTFKGTRMMISALEAKTYYFKDLSRFEIEKLLCQIGFPFPLVSFDFNSTLISKLKLNEMSLADFVATLLSGINDDGYLSENKESIELVVLWVVTYFQDLKFKNDVQHLIITKRPQYANFCALLLNATETVWKEICHLKVIPCGNNRLHCTTELVMSCNFKNLCPYICAPADWVKSKCETFISRCKIRDSLSLNDMINIVRNIQKEHGQPPKPLHENTTLKGFLEIMNEIAGYAKKFGKSQAEIYEFKLPLPDNKGYLQSVDKLLYNKLSTSDQPDFLVVHKAVPKDIALFFGAKTLQDIRLKQDEAHTDDFPHTHPRENAIPTKAEKYWKTAKDDLKAAFDARQCQNIEIGKGIGNEHVIGLAQQAIEKALKAVLFAEIGAAEEKHHNLPSLAQKAVDRTRCSKNVIHKVWKFVSECDADISSRLRYPDTHASTPHLTYTKSQADKAVDYAREIVEDLAKTFPAFKL